MWEEWPKGIPIFSSVTHREMLCSFNYPRIKGKCMIQSSGHKVRSCSMTSSWRASCCWPNPSIASNENGKHPGTICTRCESGQILKRKHVSFSQKVQCLMYFWPRHLGILQHRFAELEPLKLRGTKKQNNANHKEAKLMLQIPTFIFACPHH